MSEYYCRIKDPECHVCRQILRIEKESQKCKCGHIWHYEPEMPADIKSILLSGKMTKAEYDKVHRYYIDKACRSDWFGSYGVDGGGHFYHYVVGYRSNNEVTYKVYLED